MTTLPLRAHHVQPTLLPGFARLLSVVSAFFDVFFEAHAKARAAHQKYPFADW